MVWAVKLAVKSVVKLVVKRGFTSVLPWQHERFYLQFYLGLQMCPRLLPRELSRRRGNIAGVEEAA
jgi:hypothetical protein